MVASDFMLLTLRQRISVAMLAAEFYTRRRRGSESWGRITFTLSVPAMGQDSPRFREESAGVFKNSDVRHRDDVTKRKTFDITRCRHEG
jgi:hypothetical protein